MTLYEGAGTASGSSSASLEGSVTFYQSGTAGGSSSMSGAGGTLYLSTGQIYGTSELLWDYIQDGSGTASGSSSMSGDATRIQSARGVAQGSSELLQSTVYPMWGTSTLVGHATVDKSVVKAITMGPKTFSWLQLLQRGDLSIYVCETDGGIVVPSVIVYSLYFVRPDGSRLPIGPQQNRRPVPGEPGEFYVTGRAGEGGQPGRWIIEWKIQKSPEFPLQVEEMEFLVFDAVLRQDPRDLTDRKVKFGWN